MSERTDDIEFDFFDEPQTEEAPAREPRVLRRPQGPKRPMRPPTGVTPLLRLVGLVAFAILVVVLLVFWVQSCQEAQKEEAYRDYLTQVKTLGDDSVTIGRELNDVLTTPGLKQADLEEQLNGLVQRQELIVSRARNVEPPGPLRPPHQNAIEALEFRVSGLRGLAETFVRTRDSQDAGDAGELLAEQAERLVASDVVWDDLFMETAAAELRRQGVTGVEVPDSNFVQTPDLASTRSMVPIWQRIHGATTGGTPTGLHGTGIGTVRVLPSEAELSQSTENTIEASTALAFAVDVQNTGDNQEVKIVVRLTINQAPTPIEKRGTIDIINPGETQTVTFRDFPQVQFGERVTLRVDIEPVPGEKNTGNNSAEYPVIFSLG